MTGGMPIEYEGILYQSSEGAYQASKFFKKDHQKLIASASNGYAAKLVAKNLFAEVYGMKRSAFLQVWEAHSTNVMFSVMLKKYAKHQARIDTDCPYRKFSTLVELSHKDDFWGCKPGSNLLKGRNVLGKLWNLIFDRDGRSTMYERLCAETEQSLLKLNEALYHLQ
jgi:predicted NAD-dependent protein-ADP-ribosyltransferase YbiA (DUF1768 family)